MKYFQYTLLVILSLFILYCGTDYAEEGKTAFNKKDYSETIRLFALALKEDSTNRSHDEMISISYLHRGEDLFLRTRNLKAFDGNFKEAQEYLPANPSKEFEKIYGDMHVSLAKAYITTKTSSKEEKELNFEHALSAVKGALTIDSTNATAESLLVSLKEGHFQGLIDKGENLYNKARRTRNPDLYFTAEYYLKEAQKFESDNPKINSLLQKITQQTLSVLNYREGVSMAVAGVTRERKAIIMKISIKNYTSKPMNLLLGNFTLVDNQGEVYQVNKHEMRKKELFGEECLADTILNSSNPGSSGIIAFNAPTDIEIAYLNYKIGQNNVSRKYFH